MIRADIAVAAPLGICLLDRELRYQAWNDALETLTGVPADEALGLVGLTERADHFPSQMSGGEQQRVAIARALVNNPAILLADEPTGNLDTENSDKVLSVLRDLNERLGQTILMITHNPEAAAYGHRTVTMRDGRIASWDGSL